MTREELIEKIMALQQMNDDDMTRPSQIKINRAWIWHYINRLKNEEYDEI